MEVGTQVHHRVIGDQGQTPRSTFALEQVPALILNSSFLDVLPRFHQSLAEIGFAVTTASEFFALPPATRRDFLASVQVVLGPGRFTHEDIVAARRLKVISLAASGYESINVDAATELGIVVTNAPTRVGTESVADLTFGLILAVARDLCAANHRLKAGSWRRTMGVTVWNKTLGIIGLGRIGRAVARRARGFEMTVLALDHHTADPLTLELGMECVPMDELLRRSDFVSLHTRYNAETHHLIGPAQLASMRPTAYLINTARAGLVDEAALVEALQNGGIAGSGLDVYEGAPDTANPLLALPNVVVTPHLGNRALEGVHDVVECSIQNATDVLRGQRPRFLVNPAVYERGVR